MLRFMGSQRVGHDGATELNREKGLNGLQFSESVSHSVVSNSLSPHGLYPLSMESSRLEHCSG